MKTSAKAANYKPLVSIVINNYNYARFVSAAIDSALAQTYPNTEIIVVDDGSTDDSRRVIESYGKRIKAIFKENGGQGSALNRGYEAASGELVYFLDADDIALPDCLAAVVEYYTEAEKPVALLNFRIGLMDADEKEFDVFHPPKTIKLPGKDVSERLRKKGTYRHQPTSANVFAADALKKIMPIPEKDFRICAETYLCYHAPLFGEAIGIEETLALYRVHQNNNYHQPEKVYDSSGIIEYVEKQAAFYTAVADSRRRFARMLNLPNGGNSETMRLIFKAARCRIAEKGNAVDKSTTNFRSAAESLRAAKKINAFGSLKSKAAVMFYLAMIAFLPRQSVVWLIRTTFISSPKSLDFLIKKAFSN